MSAQPVVDMTPSKGEVRELLGGQVTISGLYEQVGSADLNVVVRVLVPSWLVLSLRLHCRCPHGGGTHTRARAMRPSAVHHRVTFHAAGVMQIVTLASAADDVPDNQHVLPQPFAVRGCHRYRTQSSLVSLTVGGLSRLAVRARTQSTRAASCCSATTRTPSPSTLRCGCQHPRAPPALGMLS